MYLTEDKRHGDKKESHEEKGKSKKNYKEEKEVIFYFLKVSKASGFKPGAFAFLQPIMAQF